MAETTKTAHLYNSLVQLVRSGVDVFPPEPTVSEVQHPEAAVLLDRGGRVRTGIIAGAFDVIHPGYIKAFKEARQYCERLVVALHIDPTVERSPDKLKPVLSVSERIEILESIRYVDEVLFYRLENDLYHILEIVNPDVRFLGEDYDIGLKAVTGSELNIPVHFLDRSHGWSTTKFKRMICKSMEGS